MTRISTPVPPPLVFQHLAVFPQRALAVAILDRHPDDPDQLWAKVPVRRLLRR